MKKIAGVVALAMLFSSILAACGSDSSPNKGSAGGNTNKPTYTFRLADNHPVDYPTVIGDKKFAELVNEKTEGRITIEVFPAGQLGDEKSVLEQVQLGAIDFTRVSASPLAEFNDQFSALNLPYIFESDEHLWNFLNGSKGEELLVGLEQAKMRGLAYYTSGSRNFYSSKPVTSLKDLKGQKLRVQQSKINLELVAALGGSATPMPYGEVFSGLQTGIVDGAENNLPSFDSSNHYQAAKHLIMDHHQRIPEVLLIGKSTWDKLSAEDQEIIKQAAIDSVVTQKEEWAKWEKNSLQKVRDAGVTITEVTDLTPWKDAVKPLIDQYKDKYKDLLDAIEQAK